MGNGSHRERKVTMTRFGDPTYYDPLKDKVMCADGKLRTCYVLRFSQTGDMASDTYFSVPAYVRVRKTSVRGYISSPDYADEEKLGPAEGKYLYVFRAYLYCKNWRLIEGDGKAEIPVAYGQGKDMAVKHLLQFNTPITSIGAL